MRTGNGQRLKGRKIVRAARTARIRFDRVKGLPIDGVVIATKRLARARSIHCDSYSARQIHEIESVSSRLGERAVAGNGVVQHLLDVTIRYRRARVRCGERNRTNARAMPNLILRGIVLRKLIDERTGQNVIEEA